MNSESKKTLYFFVSAFPTGNGETFVETELNVIENIWDKINLIRNIDENNESRKVTQFNCECMAFVPDFKKYIFFKNPIFLRIFLGIIFSEIIHSRQRGLFFKNLRSNVNLLISAFNQAKKLQLFGINQNQVYYSYWFNEWNLTLSILKELGEIKAHVTRAHGFDLYENNGKVNYLPFRFFCLKNTNCVYTVSQFGEKYLKEIYPSFKSKIKTSYLGTLDFGVTLNTSMNDRLVVLSCGSLVEVKRPWLVLDVLTNIKSQVIWYHIGDGYLYNELLNKSSKVPPNIEVVFLGRLNSSEVMNFYRTHYVDCFINTSISEGLPVAIMEAISFGIPVVATNVGGTSEIVIEGLTGHLVPVNFNIIDVAIKLSNIRVNFYNKRSRIRRFWEENFNAKLNYKQFHSEIISTSNN